MNAFIKRNTPIFVIGFIVLVIFLLLIFLSQTDLDKNSSLPTLIKIQDEPQNQTSQIEDSEVNRTEKKEPAPDYLNNQTPEQKQKQKEIIDQAYLSKEGVAKHYGEVEIKFSEDGFEPKNVTLYKWQTVKFVNTTDKPITIKQTTPKYDVFKQGVTLSAGEEFKFEIDKERLWTFMEVGSKNRGSIFANVALNIF